MSNGTKLGLGMIALAVGMHFFEEPSQEAGKARGELSVLIKYEQDDRDKYPYEQAQIFLSQDLAAYLDEVTPIRPDGEHAYRIWDDDTDTKNADPLMAEMLKDSKTPSPSIEVRKGTKVVVDQPLPNTVKGVKDLVGGHR